MNSNYFDLYYPIIKSRNEEEIVNKQYEDNENDYINYNDFILRNHNIAFKPRETILR